MLLSAFSYQIIIHRAQYPTLILMPVLLCYTDQSILRTYLTLSLGHLDQFISRYHKIYRERYFGTENSDVEELE